MLENLKKEIIKDQMETLKMSRTEIQCKMKHQYENILKIIEKNTKIIRDNQTDTNMRFEGVHKT